MDGTLEQRDDGRWQLRFTRTLPHPPEKVWRAITEPEHLAHWFPSTIEGERTAGAPLVFAFPNGKAPSFEGTMLAYEPPSVLELSWGSDVLRLELRPDGDGTVLTLLDTLDDRGKGARDAAGWQVCLDNLAHHLRGEQTDHQPAAWRAAHHEYVERFGPEAATIGPPDELVERE